MSELEAVEVWMKSRVRVDLEMVLEGLWVVGRNWSGGLRRSW